MLGVIWTGYEKEFRIQLIQARWDVNKTTNKTEEKELVKITKTPKDSVAQILLKTTTAAYNQKFDTVLTSPGFRMALRRKSDVVSHFIRNSGMWDGSTSYIMLQVMSSKQGNHTIVDFGANLGWFSLLAASKGHHAISIEALHANMEKLQHSVAVNGFESKIEMHSYALSGKIEDPVCMGFHIQDGASNAGNGQMRRNGACLEWANVSTLDTIVQNRDILFMKADCEGCEAAAFMGGYNLFLSRPPCSVVIEWRPKSMRQVGDFEPSRVVRMFKETGYTFLQYRGHLVTGQGVQIMELDNNRLSILNDDNIDVLLLHNSKRCFTKNSVAYHNLIDSINLKGNSNAAIAL